jgi:leucyl-tRNA synthetase
MMESLKGACMKPYDIFSVEKKWQQYWHAHKVFKSTYQPQQKKYYVLDMFPYPSASGLHVGHIEGYTATDIVSRFKRMQGYNVLHPMGWDAFGLPAEQYALKTGKDPRTFTYQNIENFKRQIIESGKGVDWDRELATADPEYYEWTQWIFKKLYEKGLAVLKQVEVNFCEALGTVLANDEIEVIDGKMVSERGHFPVVKKAMRQWVLKITHYAERLLSGLEHLDWPEHLKEMQRHWIGKSEGAMVDFKLADHPYQVTIFTTRPDTLFGATYMVLAPEHPLVLKITSEDERQAVLDYIETTQQKLEIERAMDKEKTGVFIGAYAINPVNQQKIPIWIADYVMASYGTGAIMAVPAHDDRDYEFAKKFDLNIVSVIEHDEIGAYTGDGKHIHSEFLNGLNNEDAIQSMNDYLEKYELGYRHITYKMRDWVFSRQRYWGEPFPVVFNEEGDIILLDDGELPLNLPVMDNIQPSGTGESPLKNAKEWLYTTYHGQKVTRDTNTMPQLAGSSWYFIGYLLKGPLGMMPLNSKEAKDIINYYLPVDLYIGGTEHAVGHLLYSRFWTKVLYDLDILNVEEPFIKLFNQGVILGDDHTRMSKSKGNTVNPDDVINEYGADALRLFEMFLGPLEAEKPWSTEGLIGARKFLDRVYRMFEFVVEADQDELKQTYHQTIKKVTEDFETLSFNTAISQLMIFVNEVYKHQKIGQQQARTFLKLLNPICPHITEELNESELNYEEKLVYSEWPTYDEAATISNEVEVVVQVNGKLRAKLQVSRDTDNKTLEILAFNEDNVIKFTEGLDIVKIIIIPNKLVNIVVK